jgi:hypothetical protein
MPFTLPPGKQVVATFNPTDASGNSGSVATPPTWLASDPTIIASPISVQGTGLGATLLSTGKPGTCTITVTEANPNGFSVSDTITVPENPAAGGTFSYGTPF